MWTTKEIGVLTKGETSRIRNRVENKNRIGGKNGDCWDVRQ